MSKYLKFLFLVMLIGGTMASPVFAGNISFFSSAASQTVDISLEAMGTARNYTLGSNTTNAVNAAFRINPGQTISSGSVLTLSLSNLAFNGSAVYVCDGGNFALAPVATATPAINATSASFVLGNTVAGTSNLVVTTIGNSTNCTNGTGNSAGSLGVRFPAVTSSSLASATYSVSLSGTTYDSGNLVANNIANIRKEYTTAYVSNNSTIDFLNASGNKFTGNILIASGTSTGANINITRNANNLVLDTTGSGNGALTVSAILGLQDTASWQGVSKVYLTNSISNTCAAANNIVMNSSPSGTVNLSLPTGTFNGTGTGAVTVCAEVTGNSTLNTRTITGAIDISVSTGGNDPSADSYTTLMTWLSNGYQGVIPYSTTYTGYPLYCLVNNTGSSSSSITVDILTSESGATLSSLSGLSLGSVVASGQKLISFSGTSITPYSYSSGTESAGTAVSLTGLNSTLDRYAARINVTTSPSNVTVKCYQATPHGSYTDIPVFTSGSDSSYLKY